MSAKSKQVAKFVDPNKTNLINRSGDPAKVEAIKRLRDRGVLLERITMMLTARAAAAKESRDRFEAAALMAEDGRRGKRI